MTEDVASRPDVQRWESRLSEEQFQELLDILDNGVACCLDDAIGAMQNGETFGTWTFGILIIAADIEFRRVAAELARRPATVECPCGFVYGAQHALDPASDPDAWWAKMQGEVYSCPECGTFHNAEGLDLGCA